MLSVRRLKNSFILCSLLFIASCTNLIRPNYTQEIEKLRQGQYKLDKQHSFLIFRIEHLGLSKIVGRFNDLDATLNFDPDKPTEMTLSGLINAASIDINNKDLENTLQEPDWFNSKAFPQLLFNSESVTASGEQKFTIAGTLSMRGITQPLTINAIFNGGADNLITRKYTIGFSATASLQRSAYGMDAFSAFVGDTVEVELHGEFLRQ